MAGSISGWLRPHSRASSRPRKHGMPVEFTGPDTPPIGPLGLPSENFSAKICPTVPNRLVFLAMFTA